MFPSTIEFLSHKHGRDRLIEAEQIRLVKLAARQERSLVMFQKLKLGLLILLIKVGLLIGLLTLTTFLTIGT